MLITRLCVIDGCAAASGCIAGIGGTNIIHRRFLTIRIYRAFNSRDRSARLALTSSIAECGPIRRTFACSRNWIASLLARTQHLMTPRAQPTLARARQRTGIIAGITGSPVSLHGVRANTRRHIASPGIMA